MNWLQTIIAMLFARKPAQPAKVSKPPVVQDDPQLTDDIDLSTVVWHGPDIRGWTVAADLKAGIRGGEITLATDLLRGKAATGDNGTSGNAWAIVLCADGKWHASTYEWIDYSRQSRSLWKAFDKGHWTSSAVEGAKTGKGVEFFVAVATVSRGGKKANGNERTPFRKVVHP